MAIRPQARLLIIAAVLILLGAGAVWWLLTRGQESTDDAQIEAHVVPVSPEVPGYITEVNVVDNQHVKAGDVLVKIDPTDYQIRLDQAKANLAAAQAQLAQSQNSFSSTRVTAPSDEESAKAQVLGAQANLAKAEADLTRYESMSDLARTQKQLDDARVAEREARSMLAYAQAKLRGAEIVPKTVAAAKAGVEQLEAAEKKAEADVANAETQLKYTTLVAPFDGRVTRKNVEIGAYVESGQSLMALVSEDYWVVANFKETQLTNMKPGQNAEIRLDAYPQRTYHGKVDSIQSGTGARFSAFPPENATGNFVKIVQRVPVKILFDERLDASLPVGPGMSVEPTVYTSH